MHNDEKYEEIIYKKNNSYITKPLNLVDKNFVSWDGSVSTNDIKHRYYGCVPKVNNNRVFSTGDFLHVASTQQDTFVGVPYGCATITLLHHQSDPVTQNVFIRLGQAQLKINREKKLYLRMLPKGNGYYFTNQIDQVERKKHCPTDSLGSEFVMGTTTNQAEIERIIKLQAKPVINYDPNKDEWFLYSRSKNGTIESLSITTEVSELPEALVNKSYNKMSEDDKKDFMQYVADYLRNKDLYIPEEGARVCVVVGSTRIEGKAKLTRDKRFVTVRDNNRVVMMSTATDRHDQTRFGSIVQGELSKYRHTIDGKIFYINKVVFQGTIGAKDGRPINGIYKLPNGYEIRQLRRQKRLYDQNGIQIPLHYYEIHTDDGFYLKSTLNPNLTTSLLLDLKDIRDSMNTIEYEVSVQAIAKTEGNITKSGFNQHGTLGSKIISVGDGATSLKRFKKKDVITYYIGRTMSPEESAFVLENCSRANFCYHISPEVVLDGYYTDSPEGNVARLINHADAEEDINVVVVQVKDPRQPYSHFNEMIAKGPIGLYGKLAYNYGPAYPGVGAKIRSTDTARRVIREFKNSSNTNPNTLLNIIDKIANPTRDCLDGLPLLIAQMLAISDDLRLTTMILRTFLDNTDNYSRELTSQQLREGMLYFLWAIRKYGDFIERSGCKLNDNTLEKITRSVFTRNGITQPTANNLPTFKHLAEKCGRTTLLYRGILRLASTSNPNQNRVRAPEPTQKPKPKSKPIRMGLNSSKPVSQELLHVHDILIQGRKRQGRDTRQNTRQSQGELHRNTLNQNQRSERSPARKVKKNRGFLRFKRKLIKVLGNKSRKATKWVRENWSKISRGMSVNNSPKSWVKDFHRLDAAYDALLKACEKIRPSVIDEKAAPLIECWLALFRLQADIKGKTKRSTQSIVDDILLVLDSKSRPLLTKLAQLKVLDFYILNSRNINAIWNTRRYSKLPIQSITNTNPKIIARIKQENFEMYHEVEKNTAPTTCSEHYGDSANKGTVEENELAKAKAIEIWVSNLLSNLTGLTDELPEQGLSEQDVWKYLTNFQNWLSSIRDKFNSLSHDDKSNVIITISNHITEIPEFV